jgi:hypothetical protein
LDREVDEEQEIIWREQVHWRKEDWTTLNISHSF